MADSTYLKKVVEPFVVKWVSEHVGIELSLRRVVVGLRSNGDPVHFEFDGVSPDGAVGLLTSAGRSIKPGALRKLHVDASILLRAPFRRRIMAFVHETVPQNFINKCDGLLPLGGIEMIVCDSVPHEMQERLDAFHAEARTEVGDKGRTVRFGASRR